VDVEGLRTGWLAVLYVSRQSIIIIITIMSGGGGGEKK